MDFEKAFGRISAISNASAQDIEVWRDQVMDLSGVTARAPAELAEALYFLSSAGIDAGKVMGVLDLSAKAAAVGLGSSADIAKITANAMNAYAEAGLTAAQVTDTLVAAVREGSAEPEEFAASLGRVLPIAAQAGIGFDQVTASLASLSNIGLDVNEGATALRGLLMALAAAAPQTQAALAELGLSADDVRASLAEDGLIATLRMLEEASGGNVDAMRELVPNVRALVGAFGLTGQEAEKVDAIFASVLDSSGSLATAWDSMQANEAFQLQQAMNNIRVSAEGLAIKALPTLAKATDIAAGNLDALALMLVGSAAKSRLAEAGFVGAGRALGTFATVIGLSAIAGRTLGDAFDGAALSVEELASVVAQKAIPAWETGAISLAEYNLAMAAAEAPTWANVQALEALYVKLDALEQAELAETEAKRASMTAWLAYQDVLIGLKPDFDAVASAANRAGRAGERLPEDLREALIGELPAIVGTVVKYKDAFSLSPSELQKITATWAKIGQTMADDLAVVLESDLKPKMKAGIAALPPEMRHAWVEGNASQRRAIEASLLETFNLEATIAKLVTQARIGGTSVGRDMAHGIAVGIESEIAQIKAAAVRAVNEAIAAARTAARAESPSKRMKELGVNLIEGLIEGIDSKTSDLIASVKEAMEEGLGKAWLALARHMDDVGNRITRRADDIMEKMDALRNKMRAFRDEIRSGFDVDLLGGLSSLMDEMAAFNADQASGGLGGLTQPMDAGAYLSGQVAQMAKFAALLTQLQAAGLNQNVLADLASRGPEAAGLATALLADPALLAALNAASTTIAQIGNQVAQGLTNSVFGEQMGALRDKLQAVVDRLDKFTERMENLIAEIRQWLRNLPKAGRGGIVSSPTLLWAGESGPEAIVPLGRSAGGTVNYNTVNVNAGAYVHERDVATYIANALIELDRRGGRHHPKS